ncbi:hypothetical protein MHYP_G00151250 [Metynnis hypsauchen]
MLHSCLCTATMRRRRRLPCFIKVLDQVHVAGEASCTVTVQRSWISGDSIAELRQFPVIHTFLRSSREQVEEGTLHYQLRLLMGGARRLSV